MSPRKRQDSRDGDKPWLLGSSEGRGGGSKESRLSRHNSWEPAGVCTADTAAKGCTQADTRTSAGESQGSRCGLTPSRQRGADLPAATPLQGRVAEGRVAAGTGGCRDGWMGGTGGCRDGRMGGGSGLCMSLAISCESIIISK